MKTHLFYIGILLCGYAILKAVNPLFLYWSLSDMQNYCLDALVFLLGFTLLIYSFIVPDKQKIEINNLIRKVAWSKNEANEHFGNLVNLQLEYEELEYKHSVDVYNLSAYEKYIEELRNERDKYRTLCNSMESEIEKKDKELFSLRGNFAQSKNRYNKLKYKTKHLDLI